MRQRRFAATIAALVTGVFGVTASHGYDRITGEPFASRSEVLALNGMAATSHPLATGVAIDVLKAGGNAVDAAIAANAALGLMEPVGNGIGGDLYAIVWDAKSKRLYGLNASGKAPMGLTIDLVRARGHDRIPPFGPLPVSVPGCVDGWYELHERFGRLPMADILQPTIDYARAGFPVTELIAHYWGYAPERYSQYPGFAETFLIDGKPPAKGDVFRNPRLARTLERIAAEGRDLFYKGDIARTIADYMQRNGGVLTYDDMASHTSQWIEPVSTNYRGYEVHELPPNGQGIAALQMLNILEGFDIASMGYGSADYLHTLIETKKLVYEDRARYYADMDFADVPVDWLISKEYAAERRKLIDPERAADRYAAGATTLQDGDTTYLTVADRDGNMVSLIQSNYRGMGSGMVPGELGFMLQDRAELFSLDPTHANALEPGKRPFHTIIPAFVTKDGEPLMSFGVMGGGMQPQGHVQIIVNMVDFGMNVQEAGDAARMHHGGSSEPTGSRMTDGGIVNLESGIEAHVKRELDERGHVLQHAVGPYGGYQAIYRDPETGVYSGASESRKDGQAQGY